MNNLDGYFDYPVDKKHTDKVNALRRAKSLVQIRTAPPMVPKSAVLFTSAAHMNNEPASCGNCINYLENQDRCAVIGDQIIVRSFVVGNIKYYPCCGYHQFGNPMMVKGEVAEYLAHNDPGDIGLIWINQAVGDMETPGGANCGGINGGDDCDHYLVDTEKKWESPNGMCRVLQTQVGAGDVCGAWIDDDRIEWFEAQSIIQDQDGKPEMDSSIPGGKLKDSVKREVEEPDNNKE